MGKGIDLARESGNDLHADVLDDFKDQLLIALIKRLGDAQGHFVLPVKEADDTGGDLLAFSVQGLGTRQAAFHFQVRKKQ